MKEKLTTKRVKFENPPINELVFAVYYKPINELKAQYIGRFWDFIISKYPNCEQQPPISLRGFAPDVPDEIFPLPRFWFHSGQGTPLIQVQRDAFIFNWRSDGTKKYPHYEDLKKQFVVEFENYRRFLKEVLGQELKSVNRYELTYINVIPENELWKDPADIAQLFPPLSSLTSIQGATRKLAGLNCTSSYFLQDNLSVDSVVRFGKRIDTQQTVAVLELKAYGAKEGFSVNDVLAWYDTAHDATDDMFLDFTDKSMQRTIWKPTDAQLR